MKITFAKSVRKDVRKLDRKVQDRIRQKLIWLAGQEDPTDFVEFLIDSGLGDYRFRVGDYRVTFDIDGKKQEIKVNKIGHRRDIYQ